MDNIGRFIADLREKMSPVKKVVKPRGAVTHQAVPSKSFDKTTITTLFKAGGGFEQDMGINITPLKTEGEKRKGDMPAPSPQPNSKRANTSPAASSYSSPSNDSSLSSQHSNIRSSPASTPYAKRTDAGELLVCYNPCNIERASKTANKVMEVESEIMMGVEWKDGNIPYRYMWNNLDEKADVLNARMVSMLEEIQQHNANSNKSNDGDDVEDEFSSITVASSEPVLIGGRVCVEGEGRLNAQSCILEGDRGTVFIVFFLYC